MQAAGVTESVRLLSPSELDGQCAYDRGAWWLASALQGICSPSILPGTNLECLSCLLQVGADVSNDIFDFSCNEAELHSCIPLLI